MARIVLGIGSSHSPLLNTPPEDFAKHAEIDQRGRALIDNSGAPVSYAELISRNGDRLAKELTAEVFAARAARCDADIARLKSAIARASLDALIVIGDDQHEQYFDDNMPSILVYWGETIVNKPLDMPDNAPRFWRVARSQYHEDSRPREYPVASALGLHLIESLLDAGFDISHARRLPAAHGEGHAFGFVHRRLMDAPTPIVPIALNTYFPPNQPRPKRCYALGRALADAVRTYSEVGRIGVLASGGLSHFVIDEALDRALLEACRTKDTAMLAAIDPKRLQSGTSEVRNWIAAAGAFEELNLQWQDYVPCYRSPAGTGCAMAFALWS